MNYLKYTQYIYLVFAVYFIYDGITTYMEGKENPLMQFFIAGMAIFMFFFRRKFAKKMSDRNPKS
ncbi:hypothetical protein FFWV33_06440 [Flavobacterium faecale]|uniref:Uncharacterized protein n=1 Tax=Flavobacterium faecale TaxID=1355330 RepID=A0A2S1LBY1_9FLAO|nr:hypothetical protein [Flavobacterium faecale]AWG21197.1 hypothetical protein FFWV33_06440 [Flavobacterium faecale]